MSTRADHFSSATLYTTPLSANGRKPLAVAHELDLAPRVEIVDVYKGAGRSPSYLAIHPLGKIPTLVDGDLTLWESNAIIVYLAEAHGGGRLWSTDPKVRADIARWLFWESSQWQPALATVLAPFVGDVLRGGDGGDVAIDWRNPAFVTQATFLNDHFANHDREREWLAADGKRTVADYSVAGMLTYARRARFPFAAYPHLGRWFERIEALDAWQSTASTLW